MSGERAPRPHVLMVVGAYYPEVAGGGLQCRTLILALRDRVDFTVLATTATSGQPLLSMVDGVPVYRIENDLRRPFTKLRGIVQFARALWHVARHCDVFHFHGFTQRMLALVPVARLAGRPMIEKMTSVGWDDPVSMQRRPNGGRLFRAFEQVDAFVSISPAMSKRMADASLPAERVTLIPNGVDTARFAPVDAATRGSIRAALGLSPAAWIVTFVGFWSREKSPGVLFQAWLQLVRRGVQTELLFVGATSEHLEADAALVADVKARAKAEGVTDRLRLVEHTLEVPRYLQASDAFVLPSSREGLPNALLEAMATGLPCVCTRLPGVTDWVIQDGRNGSLVPADDVSALAAALDALHSDPERARAMGARARETMREQFAIERVADRYFDLYSRLLGRPADERRPAAAKVGAA